MYSSCAYSNFAGTQIDSRLSTGSKNCAGDGVDREHVACCSGANGPRGHVEDHAGGFVLYQGFCAKPTKRKKPADAVAPHSRQQDANGGAFSGCGKGVEELVNRGAIAVLRRRTRIGTQEHSLSGTLDTQVQASWGEEDGTGLKNLTVRSLVDTEFAERIEISSKASGKAWGKVLDNDQADGKVLGDPAKKDLKTRSSAS